MALRLSTGEVGALEQANTVLLAPFAYEDSVSWRCAAARAVEVCLGGDGSSFALPIAGETVIAASPEIAAALQAILPPPEWIVRGLMERRRALHLSVTDWDELFDANIVRRTPFYNDVVRPHGLLAPLVMVRDTGAGGLPAALSVYFSNEGAAQRHAPRRKELLRLLFPAFCAGLRTYLAFQRNRAALGALAEDAAVGVLFLDDRGRVTRENVFFQQLMCCEPARDRVRAEVVRVVRAILRSPVTVGMASGPRRAHSTVRTGSAHYRIAATFLEDEWSHESVMAVALVEKVEGRAADATQMAARFSLTHREIEAAQLLRGGLSSRQIAADLGISVNTARRHIERILLKLDVHSRTAAAAKLSREPN
jgi:DNA-binding CsgD family transcriptional regulator